METTHSTAITVHTVVNAPLDKVWEFWTVPDHITRWYFASDDWHAPYADNDLKQGGKFKTRMAAKDESMGFDFEGVYTKVEPQKKIAYVLADGRKVDIEFFPDGNKTRVEETFDPESTNPVEMQRQGWQMIMDNFRKYAERTA